MLWYAQVAINIIKSSGLNISEFSEELVFERIQYFDGIYSNDYKLSYIANFLTHLNRRCAVLSAKQQIKLDEILIPALLVAKKLDSSEDDGIINAQWMLTEREDHQVGRLLLLLGKKQEELTELRHLDYRSYELEKNKSMTVEKYNEYLEWLKSASRRLKSELLPMQYDDAYDEKVLKAIREELFRSVGKELLEEDMREELLQAIQEESFVDIQREVLKESFKHIRKKLKPPKNAIKLNNAKVRTKLNSIFADNKQLLTTQLRDFERAHLRDLNYELFVHGIDFLEVLLKYADQQNRDIFVQKVDSSKTPVPEQDNILFNVAKILQSLTPAVSADLLKLIDAARKGDHSETMGLLAKLPATLKDFIPTLLPSPLQQQLNASLMPDEVERVRYAGRFG